MPLNFVVRHGSTAPTQLLAAQELASIDAAVLIVESQYAIRPPAGGADAGYSAAQVAAMRVGGRDVLAYTSLGSIDANRDIFSSFAAVAQPGGGEVTLRFWEKDAGGAYKILTPMIAWLQSLKADGYSGAFLDVLNSYTVDSVWPLIASNKVDAYQIATTAIIEIVIALEAALNGTGGPEFKIALGNNSDLLLHNAHPGGATTYPKATSGQLAQFRAAIDYVVVESLPITATSTAGVPTVRFDFDAIRILDILGIRPDPGVNTQGAYAFGDADLLLVNYFDSDGVFDGGVETWRALSLQIEAARLGITPYATPNFDPDLATANLADGGNIEPFNVTYPIFNLADDAPNAMLADAGRPNLSGLGGDDYLAGDSGANQLDGGAGADLLEGGAGHDVLQGGAGRDVMLGGLGDDTYYVDDRLDRVIEAANAGTDTVYSEINFSLDGLNVENLTLMGSAGLRGIGDHRANILIGNSGANRLDGRAGADTMQGGADDDTYLVDAAGDTVIELAGQGTDSVQATVSYTLPDHVENLRLVGTAVMNATGNALANNISGGGGANVIIGHGGADRLTGGGGADVFRYLSVGDSNAAGMDLIFDLQNIDRIDLTAIDANTLVGGDQDFTRVAAFSNQAGQMVVRYNAAQQRTVVEGDVNGDGVVDFRLALSGDKTGFTGYLGVLNPAGAPAGDGGDAVGKDAAPQTLPGPIDVDTVLLPLPDALASRVFDNDWVW